MTDDRATDFATRLTGYLYERYGNRMYCTADVLLPDSLQHWCLDAVHETFAAFLVAVRADRIEAVCGMNVGADLTMIEAPCLAYLLASLENRCRELAVRSSRFGAESLPPQLWITDDLPENVVERADLREAVNRAIDALPDHWRSVVTLCHIEGYHYREAAERLGIPLGTLQSRLSRARRALNDELDGVFHYRDGDQKGGRDECQQPKRPD